MNAPRRGREWSVEARATGAALGAVVLGMWGGVSAAAPPESFFSQELAAHMLSGRHVRMVILGDSICNPLFGTFWSDGADRNHFPPQNGMHNVWTPAAGWYGVNVPAAAGVSGSGGYVNWKGIGAFARLWEEGRTLEPRVDLSDYPDGTVGWSVDPVSMWTLTGAPLSVSQLRMTSYLYTPVSDVADWKHGSLASEAIGRGDLRVRHIVYTGPGFESVPKLTFTRTGDTSVTLDYPEAGAGPRWAGIDYPAASAGSTWNPDVDRFETASSFSYAYPWQAGEQRHYITTGTLFYDASSEGMEILSISHGGDTTIDHLRTPETFGTFGYYTTRNRGWSDAGLLSWLDAHDMTTPEAVPVVMMTLGTNIGNPDNGYPEAINGVTIGFYTENVRRIIARYRALYAERGLEPYFILVAMYDFGHGFPNAFIDTRAERLWEVVQTDPHPERIGFVSLPATMGYLGAGFNPAWYIFPFDFHLSSRGSVKVAEILWDAFRGSVCTADFNKDGEINSLDFFAYLTAFAASDPAADLTGPVQANGQRRGMPDGQVQNEDFFYFLTLYSAGC